MVEGSGTTDALFESVSRRLLDAHPDITSGRMLAAPGLRTGEKFFAFASTTDLMVKLPATRVTELITSGEGQPCNPTRRGPMREWVCLAPEDENACETYLLEARSFVASLAVR